MIFILFASTANGQYKYLNLTIPGTAKCTINAQCYKDAAITLFWAAVVVSFINSKGFRFHLSQ